MQQNAEPARPARVQADASTRLQTLANSTFDSGNSVNITGTLGTADYLSSFTVFGGSSARFLVRGDGFVGIGTASPSAFVDVVRNVVGGTWVRISNSDTGASSNSYSGILLGEGATNRAQIATMNSASNYNPNGLQIWNLANGPTFFATNNLERMRIHADGNVTVGSTTNSGARLYVVDSRDGMTAMQVGLTPTVEANATQNEFGVVSHVVEQIQPGIANAGGVTAFSGRASVALGGQIGLTRGLYVESGIQPGYAGTVTNAYGAQIVLMNGASGTMTNGYGLHISDVPATTSAFGVYQAGGNDSNYFAGQIRVGSTALATTHETAKLHVTGDAHFTGTVSGGVIQAHYQDVAEWVPSTTDLAPGTVVVLNTTRNNEVMASSSPYDTSVAGVVSAQPGVSLGIPGPEKEQIATTGRVKVRVDARNAPIRVGDLLVTSSVAGTAMRSEPMAINGRNFHQPGTIIGKALEPLAGGVGEILVLLSMQ
ncbi:MAG TPA: hypothetical protein VE010_11005 [Thermoanaerobaculia bacterium]|nr:hypothetical protein [Thermoanaerobaculia bacterium]